MKRPKPEKRFYRERIKKEGFTSFELIVGESDVWISIPKNFKSLIKEIKPLLTDYLVSLRTQIFLYGQNQERFFTSLTPIEVDIVAPKIVKEMALASKKAFVGPMAGVAGAINKFLGERLKEFGISEFIIENGGDVYFSSSSEIVSSLIFGDPKLDGKLAIVVPKGSFGICSSSSRIGHSLSLGKTHLATVVAKCPILADCCATFLGNSQDEEDFIERCKKITDIYGALGFLNGKFVIFGEVKLAKVS